MTVPAEGGFDFGVSLILAPCEATRAAPWAKTWNQRAQIWEDADGC